MSDTHFALTSEQCKNIDQDILELQERASEIYRLLCAAYPEGDPRAFRAGELVAAVQRLQWAMAGSQDEDKPAAVVGDSLNAE